MTHHFCWTQHGESVEGEMATYRPSVWNQKGLTNVEHSLSQRPKTRVDIDCVRHKRSSAASVRPLSKLCPLHFRQLSSVPGSSWYSHAWSLNLRAEASWLPTLRGQLGAGARLYTLLRGAVVPDQRSGKSLPDAVLLRYLRVPFLFNGWELCEATDICALATVRRVRRSTARTRRLGKPDQVAL